MELASLIRAQISNEWGEKGKSRGRKEEGEKSRRRARRDATQLELLFEIKLRELYLRDGGVDEKFVFAIRKLNSDNIGAGERKKRERERIRNSLPLVLSFKY